MEDGTPPPVVRSTRLIETLRPEVARQARDLIRIAAAHQVMLVVVSAERSFEEQARLYSQGRTRKGPRVTNAKPGQSWHNYGRAFDVAFWTPKGLSWEGPYERVAVWAKELGLEWGGDFISFKDWDHFQNRGGMTIAQARAAKRRADQAERERAAAERKLQREEDARSKRQSDE